MRLLKLWLPEVALVPVQPPLAVQLVAFVLDHVTVVLPLYAGAIGLAEIVTVGGALPTSTVTDCVALPPAPEQVSVYVGSVVRLLKLWLPDVALVPLQPPLAEQLVAFVLDQLTVVLPLYAGAIGLAEIVTVGAGGFPTSTVTA